jgi:hypothetical protein
MNPVIKQDEYRQFACLVSSSRTPERATRQPPRQAIVTGDHPLVRSTLGAISST